MYLNGTGRARNRHPESSLKKTAGTELSSIEQIKLYTYENPSNLEARSTRRENPRVQRYGILGEVKEGPATRTMFTLSRDDGRKRGFSEN